MALEPLQAAMQERFINAGVAEQNMVSVAAGLASNGLQVWSYSIAPFLYARAFEQVRNDICLHNFDVKLVGNGGGYGYGVMGPTHHAIEDYGVLCGLQHMRAYVPAFASDVSPIVSKMAESAHPAYLRLGRCEKPAAFDIGYAPWRCVLVGDAGVLIVVGPGAGSVLALAETISISNRPEIWVATELPFAATPPPEACLARIAETDALFVLEEHVVQGGAGQMLAHLLLQRGIAPRRFKHFHAGQYKNQRYGSQAYHRVENGLDAAAVLAATAPYAAE